MDVSFLWSYPTTLGAIHFFSTKMSGNFSPKFNGMVRFNRKNFEKTGPSFEVDHFFLSELVGILVEWIVPLESPLAQTRQVRLKKDITCINANIPLQSNLPVQSKGLHSLLAEVAAASIPHTHRVLSCR